MQRWWLALSLSRASVGLSSGGGYEVRREVKVLGSPRHNGLSYRRPWTQRVDSAPLLPASGSDDMVARRGVLAEEGREGRRCAWRGGLGARAMTRRMPRRAGSRELSETIALHLDPRNTLFVYYPVSSKHRNSACLPPQTRCGARAGEHGFRGAARITGPLDAPRIAQALLRSGGDGRQHRAEAHAAGQQWCPPDLLSGRRER